MRKLEISAIVGVACLLALTACSGSHSTTATGVESKAAAVISSSANAAAVGITEDQVKTCVNSVTLIQLAQKANRSRVVSCIVNLAPSGARAQIEQCVATTATKDKVWTSAGRNAFESSGVATCVTTAIATSTPVIPTATATTAAVVNK